MKRLFILALTIIFGLSACKNSETEAIDFTKNNDDEEEITDQYGDDDGVEYSKKKYGKIAFPEVNAKLRTLKGKLPRLHTKGRFLVNENDEPITIHGFWQTYSPYFNNYEWGSGRDDAAAQRCVQYSCDQIDQILQQGWQLDFIRMHMDTHWILDENRKYDSSDPIEKDYRDELWQWALNNVYVPIMEHAIAKGLYILLPAMSAPETLEPLDEYYDMTCQIWNAIVNHPKICNNTDVMFELMNEPRLVMDENGVPGACDDSHNKALTEYMQLLIDRIRVNAKENIIWVPGTGYESQYAGYAKYKIDDKNYGFAVHVYPGWYGSDAEQESVEQGTGSMGGGYESFKKGWDNQLVAASKVAPMLITEMDWAPKVYGKSWGKSITGEAGGAGFGANLKYLIDNTGNVSYMFFTPPKELSLFNYSEGPKADYLYDPEACTWQIYSWFKSYREGKIVPDECDEIKIGGIEGNSFVLDNKKTAIINAITDKKIIYPIISDFSIVSLNEDVVKVSDNILIPIKPGKTKVTISALGKSRDYSVEVKAFEFDYSALNPNVWGSTGTWDVATHTLVTDQWGFGGWTLQSNLDLSSYSKIVCVLGKETDPTCGASFRIFDNGYWSGCMLTDGLSDNTSKNSDGDYILEIPITKNMKINSESDPDKQRDFDPSNIGIVGIWSPGGKNIVIKNIYWE